MRLTRTLGQGPKDTSTLSVDELEENMVEEAASSGLCTIFGCTVSEDKTGGSQCIIM